MDLETATSHILEECRMVLPGIQALFGFQLIAVFDDRFKQLAAHEQQLRLAAIVLVVVAIGLVMSPAAVHRHLQSVDERFVKLASRLLVAGMPPLALALCLDVYLVSTLILQDERPSALIAVALFCVLAALWLLLPRYERGRR
jgi:hypothetical protein